MGEKIVFHKLEEALKEIDADQQNVIVVGLGTTWCYPCKKGLKHLQKFSKQRTQEIDQEIKVFLVDEEKNLEFCKRNDIIGNLTE